MRASALFLGLLILGFAASARAALEFKASKLDLPPPAAGATSIDVEFPFTNTGKGPVVILETTSSCGCTVPEIAEKTYAAGASGVLKARFDIGGRQGLQTKQLTVRTDAGEHALSFTVELPQRLLVTPRLHVFLPGQPTEQTFTVAIRSDAPVKKIELGTAAPSYTAELVTKTAGTDYEIRLKLTAAAPASFAETLYVRTTGASGIEYVDSYFIRRTP